MCLYYKHIRLHLKNMRGMEKFFWFFIDLLFNNFSDIFALLICKIRASILDLSNIFGDVLKLIL